MAAPIDFCPLVVRVGRVRVHVPQYLSRTFGGGGSWGGESYFPYIFLNEIQTMFSQLAKRSARVLPADWCTDHAHYVQIHRSTVLRINKRDLKQARRRAEWTPTGSVLTKRATSAHVSDFVHMAFRT